MNDVEKLIFLYEEVNGKLREDGSCYWEVKPKAGGYGDGIEGSENVLHCMKDGNSCWTRSKTDILFDYVTKDL